MIAAFNSPAITGGVVSSSLPTSSLSPVSSVPFVYTKEAPDIQVFPSISQAFNSRRYVPLSRFSVDIVPISSLITAVVPVATDVLILSSSEEYISSSYPPNSVSSVTLPMISISLFSLSRIISLISACGGILSVNVSSTVIRRVTVLVRPAISSAVMSILYTPFMSISVSIVAITSL